MELYEGVAVQVPKGAISVGIPFPQYVRFWFRTRNPERAVLIGWPRRDDKPCIYVVDTAKVRLSELASEPPAMPKWANLPCEGLHWVLERLGNGHGQESPAQKAS